LPNDSIIIERGLTGTQSTPAACKSSAALPEFSDALRSLYNINVLNAQNVPDLLINRTDKRVIPIFNKLGDSFGV
jgi:hypothetical protein